MHDLLMAFLGGAMIGLAAVLLMATNGSIMGISGIASRLMPPLSTDWQWRLVFLGGVLAAPLIMTLMTGVQPVIEITNNVTLLVISGLLVGFGTVIGNGCTSGHGVCGLSRLSTRSIIATSLFMSFAFVTVFIARHIPGV